ncbi:MAG: 50S ribosomal protein L11 methyltransferase, partial [Vibrio fluvialis]
MPWIQIKLNATNENAERISDMLMEETGALSITFLDAKDTPVFEPLPGETRLWGDTDVLALYDAEADTSWVLSQIRASNLLADDFAYKVEQIEDKDWEREW